MKWLLLPVALLAAAAASADEGMWTFNHFPAESVQQQYGFRPSQQWLERVRLSSARLAGGCSASFVSPEGLVMTNHHCARECVEQLSTAQRNYARDGFYARTQPQELRCPAMEVDRLVEIRDVTPAVQQATQGLEGEAFQRAQRAVFARLEKSCAAAPEVRCDVVTLYQGGRYELYKYERFQDVRLVFAPETSIAFFGGDPDNFEFPRYDYDVAFLRVYREGRPARTEPYFRWSQGGATEGMLTFVSGNPGSTSRLDTVAELEYQRDYALPERLVWLAELRGQLEQFAQRGPEWARISEGLRFSVDNAYKALRGRRAALVDEAFFAQLVASERALREQVEASAKAKREAGGAWEAMAQAVERLEGLRQELRMLEQRAGAGSDLFSYARALVRAAEEQQKPDEQRLPEFTEARSPELEQSLFSPAPVYPELEELLLTFYLTKLREELSPDHAVVKAVLGKSSPEQVSHRLVQGTRLADPQVRRRLYQGGTQALAASKDPMIAFARALDGPARAVREHYENEVESVLKKQSERIARARFDIHGMRIYPDATFTPRLSYGQVEGYVEDGRQVGPFTYLSGLYERATGEPPFLLPTSWQKARRRLDPSVPMNFVTTNDIIGGNSGSPVLNPEAEIVGIVFDGNLQSLGGEYGFDEAANRTVALHSEAIVEALQKVYGTRRLLEELGLPVRAPPATGGSAQEPPAQGP